MKVLVIGLGPGVIPTRLAKLGLNGTVVEIDPSVVAVARGYFGFSDRSFKVVLADGRQFLAHTQERFDAVLLDAFSAENEPAHLLTSQAFRAIVRILEPGGVLAINLSGRTPAAGVDNRFLDSVVRTMETVFPEVAVYRGAGDGSTLINFTVAGRLGGHAAAAAPRAAPPPHPMAAAELEGLLNRRYVPAPGSGSVYTDDWAPVEFHAAELKLRWRQALLESTPAQILLD